MAFRIASTHEKRGGASDSVWTPSRRKSFARLFLRLAAVSIVSLFLIAGLYDTLAISRYELFLPETARAFDDFKIVLLADLHNRLFGEGQAQLITAIKNEKPDIVVLCGDIIDRKSISLENVASLLNGLVPLAPVYTVAGNHEMDNPTLFAQLITLYHRMGAVYLDGESAEVKRKGQTLRFYSGQIQRDERGKQWIAVGEPKNAASDFDILLYHFGSKFTSVSSLKYDLILAGHTHGGLVRLLGKGLFDTDGLLFPKYDKGVFEENGCTMVLSGGLGGFGFPRFYNHAEAVSITLRAQPHSEGIVPPAPVPSPKEDLATLLIQLAAIAGSLLFLGLGFYDRLTVSRYELFLPKTPCAFDGFKIVLLADLHSHLFGAEQAKLVAAVENEKPDIIVLCGDVIDRRDTELTNIESLLNGLIPLAPVYAVAGNHEMDNPALFAQLITLYRRTGAMYLDGQNAEIEKEGQALRLSSGQVRNDRTREQRIALREAKRAASDLDILLYHFGGRFASVSFLGYDLVLAGHTHGGLVRLLGKGLFGTVSPLFPRYDKGVFEKNGCVMVLSGGLGSSAFPRFYNRREAVSITLRAKPRPGDSRN